MSKSIASIPPLAAVLAASLLAVLSLAILVALAPGCSTGGGGAREGVAHPGAGAAPLPRPPVLGAQIERVGRPLTANALIGLYDSEEVSSQRKEEYNRAAPADWPQFAADFERTLGLYDGLDGTCGNQWLLDGQAEPVRRYRALAALFADDRLWLDGEATACTQYLGLERAAAELSGSRDCGGRRLEYDANNVLRSLLVLGATSGADDGVHRDDRVHPTATFPFVAAP